MNVTNKAASCVGWVPSDKTYFIFERMLAVLPYPYWAWKVTFIAVFAVLSAFIVKQLIKRRLVYLDQNQKLEWYRQRSLWSDRKVQSYVLCFCATCIRFLWFLDPHWKSKTWPHIYVQNDDPVAYNIVDGVLRRLPQALVFMVAISEIFTWQESVSSSRVGVTVRIFRKRHRLRKRCSIVCLPLSWGIFSLPDIASRVDESFQAFEYIWLVYGMTVFLCLIFSAFYWLRQLQSLVQEMKSERGPSAFKPRALQDVQRIRVFVTKLAAMGCMIMIGYSLRLNSNVCTSKDQLFANARVLIFSTMFHSFEALTVLLFVNSLAPRSTQQNENNNASPDAIALEITSAEKTDENT